MHSISRRAFGALSFAVAGAGLTGVASAQDLENTLYLDLTYGRVVIQLRPDKAPKTVDWRRIDVSVRMPTAAGYCGLRIEPSGRIDEHGRRRPLLRRSERSIV